jgi:ethanolamine permease
MGTNLPRDQSAAEQAEIEQVVAEVASEAHVRVEALRPEERQYLKEHALKKPMGVMHIWALGVGAVITGEYFGWNGGLGVAGPIGMLLASLFVCALYMIWVLALSELAVAMPFAGGPLAYGRHAVGPWLGFVMGWSMFLECLFAAIGTAIATGGYLYFVLNELMPGVFDKQLTTTLGGLGTVGVFALVQWFGAREQARLMEWMTYGAILGLVWFWIACIPGVRMERIFTKPDWLMHGWSGVIRAIPYAIWWLVIIEMVALAAEEAHEPHRTIPRGLTLAQITLIVLVVLTWFFASAAGTDYRKTGDENNLYPLPYVYKEVWQDATAPDQGTSSPPVHLLAFAVVAICGMIASYNGMIYAVSRQAFSLGRAGYLPRVLGHVHPHRRTPDVSIIFWSLVTAGFVIWSYFNEGAVMTAVLTCNLAALIWYALAMVCLFILRVREPNMDRPYKVPLYPVLPALVLLMTVFAAGVYGWFPPTQDDAADEKQRLVLLLTLAMYGVGLAYYFGYARTRLASAAPEELAARAGQP